MRETVRIESIAAGGDGVGRLADGRAVFIPRTAPGDLVEPAALKLARRHARARVGRLVEAGPGRAEPRCGHYTADDCGGCQLQHLSGEAQREAKRRIAGDALRRLGRLELPDPPIEAAPDDWSYRTRISLTVRASDRAAGFHPVGRPEAVFPLRRCEIAREPLNALWAGLGPTLPAGLGEATRVTLRIGRRGDPRVILHGGPRPDAAAVSRVAAALPGVTPSLWWEPRRGCPVRLAGHGPPGEAAAAFAQVQPAMGDRIREWAVDACGSVEGRRAWDLYAGTGEAGRALAGRGALVESVELDPDAVAEAGRRGPAGITRHQGRVERWVERLERPDVVYANPPRTGLGPGVVEGILRAAPAVLVYVSCDPATLARDLRALRARFRPDSVRCFDLFPQTAHVETVVRLVAA